MLCPLFCRRINIISGPKSPAEYPIFIAVSVLSPVKTHTYRSSKSNIGVRADSDYQKYYDINESNRKNEKQIKICNVTYKKWSVIIIILMISNIMITVVIMMMMVK